MMNILFYIFIFVFGICLGSFANVLIDRIQIGKSLRGRSECDYCGYQLSWLDNIPIFSFLLLRGKCKKCQKNLSWQYPLMELGTGLIFILTFWLIQNNQIFQISDLGFGPYLSLFYYISIAYILWTIFIWDLRYMIIPDFLVLIGTIATIFYKTVSWNCYFSLECPLISALLGGLIISVFFGFIFYVSKGKWIGGGDVKLGFWLGLLVGFKMTYFFILFAYVSGSIVAIFLLLFFSKKMKSQIPFGPFLIISVYFIIFYQNLILDIWHSLLS